MDIDWTDIRAVLFDLDGVLTPTASIHQQAWAVLFVGYLDHHGRPEHAPYTDADYHAYIDGKPRFDGVRSFLASRNVVLPEGSPDDPPGEDTVSALGNRKNLVFQTLLRDEGIAPYPGSLRLLDDLAARHVAAAVVSSSRNAREVLQAAGLGARFDVVIDGEVAAQRGIAGKPQPDMFLTAARDLGVPASAAIVVEDAVSGVAAGAAGGFALVVGVDRGAGRDALVAHGAGLVVDDLVEMLP